ncbi:MAG: T9SS type A sorting domain-containing protein [Bacteroidota bacterium]
MKKSILACILLFTVFISVAQQKKNNLSSRNGIPSATTVNQITLGTSTYDLETYASVRRQTYFYPNGTIGAVWNYDQLFTMPFTVEEFYNGSSWGPGITSPDSMPGFGSLDRLSNGTEVIISYDTSVSSGLRIDTADTPGSGNWAGIALPQGPVGHRCGWPHIAIGGANGMTVHLVSLTEPVAFGGSLYNGVDGMLTYSRSEDGGTTWNIVQTTLPGWNSSLTHRMYPDEYTIDAKGNTVAIIAGGKTNDWVMWKSSDNGTTFTKTTIKAFPVPAYDAFTMISDTNSDGIPDTMAVADASSAVLIDNNGMVHCWSGSVGICDDTIATSAKLNYFYSHGLLYWNESMGSVQPVIIGDALDINNDGAIDIQSKVAEYGGGLCSMPTAGIDINNKIYVCYSMVKEGTTNGIDESYRNILAMYTSDAGATWSPSSFLTFDFFTESVFPSMARNVDSTLKLICQQDAEPGMSVWGDLDPFTQNNIMYLESDTNLLGVGPYMGGVSGLIYFDQNNNNIFDGSDNGASAMSVATNSMGSLYFYTPNGYYYSSLVYGNNLVGPYNLPPYISSTPASVNYNVTSISNFTQDFALHAITSYDSATIFLDYFDEVCFAPAYYNLIVNNYGTTIKDYVVKFHPDPVLPTPVSIYPPPDSLVNGDYYFSINGLGPLSLNDSIYFEIVTPGPGVPVTNYTDLYENNSTLLTYVHSDTIAKIISCSYDPNDKTVKPAGVAPQHYTLLNQTLDYVIRFQNTGNDTAFNVMLLDTLDTNFDISTFHILNSSHPCSVEMLQGNILRFHFNHILLPDSNVNEKASHGFVHYSIKPLAGTVANTIVYNTANIYFDFNLPVSTNTTFNTLVNVIPAGIDFTAGIQNEIGIIPNPFSENTQLIFNNEHHDLISIRLIDISGRVIKIFYTSGSKYLLNTSGIEKGIYLLRITNPSTAEVKIAKLVKD